MSDNHRKWLPLPLTLEEVTPEWLSEVLSVKHPGAEVKSFEVSDERCGTSTSARLRVEYSRTGGTANLSERVYIKGGFQDAMRRRVWAGLAIEAKFFAQIAPTLTINIPQCYFAAADEDSRQAIVILEDLAVRDVTFGHATLSLRADTVAEFLELLAQMHAQWWESPGLADFADWATPQRVYLKYLLRTKYWNEVLKRPYGDFIPELLRDPNLVACALDRLWDLNDRRPQTLIHGDCHVGNTFFERSGAPGLLDWQCTARGNWVHDVMWIIVCSMDIEGRRTFERELLKHYLDRLSAHKIKPPSFDQAWLAYRQNIMHGVSSGVANPYDMQSEMVTSISAQRILAAVSDLEVIKSLGLSH